MYKKMLIFVILAYCILIVCWNSTYKQILRLNTNNNWNYMLQQQLNIYHSIEYSLQQYTWILNESVDKSIHL